ncbi:MAG: hypothetical protein R3Y07_01840 [Eubacteriales bacterium]
MKSQLAIGVIITVIGVVLVFAQNPGAYLVLGIGVGFLVATGFSEKNAQILENMLKNIDLIWFRISELISLGLIFLDGFTEIGVIALISLICVEIYCKKGKSKEE